MPFDIAVSPDDPDIVYVKTHQDIFVSQNGGNDWIGLGHETGSYPGGLSLATDPFMAERLYLTAECPDEFCIDISPDGGLTWSLVTSTIPTAYAGYRLGSFTIQPSPHISGQIFVGASFSPPDASDYTGIFYRSADHGVTWGYIETPTPFKRITEIAFDAFNSNLIYAGTGGTGLWRSTDGGDNWVQVPISNTQSPVSIAAIAVHPNIPNKAYLRTYATQPHPTRSRSYGFRKMPVPPGNC